MIQRYRCTVEGPLPYSLFKPSHKGVWVTYKDHEARYTDLEHQIKRQDLREWMQEKNAYIKSLEADVEDLRDGNEYTLVRELREQIKELESLISLHKSREDS